MNLQQLQYFKMVAEMEHFTRAADKLSITQSSLSHAIRGMEEELNVELFTRSGRNVVLTKYGKMLLPYVTDSLSTLEAGISVLRDAIDPNSGMIAIDCFPSLITFLPDLIIQYISETKRLNIHVQTNHQSFMLLKEHLLTGAVDLAFATKIDHPDIGCAPVGHHELVLLVSSRHRLASQNEVDLEELNGEELIAYTDTCQIRHQIDGMFACRGIQPKITMETEHDLFMYSLVAADYGVAITPYPISGAPYNVRIVHIRSIEHMRTLYMMWNQSNYMSPAVEYFRDFVIKRGEVFDDFCRRNRLCGR